MKSMSGLGIGLSLVFGCLLLALVAEIYYLLRWKKRNNSKRISNSEMDEEDNNGYYAKDLIQLFCFKKSSSLQPSQENKDGNGSNPDGNWDEQQDIELGTGAGKDLLRALGADGGIEAELMKLHNQRLLFTIKEETKEDLESDDGKSKKRSRTRSLSDLVSGFNDNNTPGFLTPLASPLKSSPLTPKLESYPHHGFNPLFESDGEIGFNKFRSSSPPPKFKFLRDAEEKLLRRLMEETKRRGGSAQDLGFKAEQDDISNQDTVRQKEGSFLKFLNAAKIKEKEKIRNVPESISSSSSQVLPLSSSPAKS